MKLRRLALPLIIPMLGFLVLSASAQAATLQVGPGKTFATPCAAIAAASAGDTIQIDPSGNYAGDVCAWSTNNLHILGTGSSRVVIDANGRNSQGKGTWVINGADGTIIENIEFKNASVPDRNGAGIRIDGGSLTVRNCYFHDNQNGILAGGGSGTMLVEFSEFFHNGAGDGFSHNIYVGNYAKFIFRYNYSHGSVIGHLFKSRAAANDVYYNRLSDEATGTASYEIDIPNGGKSYIVGNLIEKGPNAQNSALLSYQGEGASSGNPNHELFIINNTMVNDLGHGTFVSVDGSVTTPVVIKNNIFQGSGTVTSQGSAVQANNFTGNALLVNRVNFDYHLLSGSPAIDAGTNPGQGSGVSLTPIFQYVHPSCAEGRVTTGGAMDIGAYEFNGGNGAPPPNAPSSCGGGAPPAPSASLSATNLTFPGQIVNTTSPIQSVTLTNSGNASLIITGVTLGGTNPGDFTETNTCGSGLAAGANCTISVTFTPTASGSSSAILSIADNASGSPQTIILSGAGVLAAPAAALSPTSLAFASQALGTTSAAQPVKLTNTGNAPLNISGISASGDFAQTNNCGTSLSSSCTINVTFTPTAGGTRTGKLTVTDDAAGSPQSASLTGTSPAPSPTVSVTPMTLSFGGELVGASSAAQTVRLSNSGNAPVSISGISVNGDFTQTNNCGSSLAAGASCSISVTFRASAGGSRTGALIIADNVNGSPQSVSLSGTGMDFSLALSSSSATVNAGQSVNLTLAATPDGGFNQVISLTCAGQPVHSTCIVSPISVTPNGSAVSSVSLSITTTARSFTIPTVPVWPTGIVPRTAPLFTILFLFLFVIGVVSRRRRLVFGFCSVLLFTLIASGCVGTTSKTAPPPPATGAGTPAGSYTLTLTGTSSNLSHSTVLTLRVN